MITNSESMATHAHGCSSPPPEPKRRKLAQERSSEAESTKPFWFDDGDIVLDVDTHHFKVHRDRLSCSPIFAGMFDLPQPASFDTVEGCPLVALSGDAARDWLVTLSWMYHPDYFKNQPVTFDILAGALRIATKYDISVLRDWAVKEMLCRWPRQEVLHDMTSKALPHAAEAITLARECDVPEILPAAFYALSVQRWTCNADGGRSHIVLSPADLRRLIAGRESLQDMLVRIIVDPLHDPGSSTPSGYVLCPKCAEHVADYWRHKLSPDPMLPHGCWLLRELHQMIPTLIDLRAWSRSSDNLGISHALYTSVCPACWTHHQTLVVDRMRKLKENIPRMFLLS